MIILNGKKFAESEEEFTNSLFEQGGTCVGYAKRSHSSVVLLDHNREKVGVINKHGVLCCATEQKDGKYWYSYADIDLIGKYESYMQQVNECESALKNAHYTKKQAEARMIRDAILQERYEIESGEAINA